MTPEQLSEIRQRNEARKIHDTEADPSYIDGDRGYAGGKRDDDYDSEHTEHWDSAIADIDALLAEVERLQTAERQRIANYDRSEVDRARQIVTHKWKRH